MHRLLKFKLLRHSQAPGVYTNTSCVGPCTLPQLASRTTTNAARSFKVNLLLLLLLLFEYFYALYRLLKLNEPSSRRPLHFAVTRPANNNNRCTQLQNNNLLLFLLLLFEYFYRLYRLLEFIRILAALAPALYRS